MATHLPSPPAGSQDLRQRGAVHPVPAGLAAPCSFFCPCFAFARPLHPLLCGGPPLSAPLVSATADRQGGEAATRYHASACQSPPAGGAVLRAEGASSACGVDGATLSARDRRQAQRADLAAPRGSVHQEQPREQYSLRLPDPGSGRSQTSS